MEYPMISFGTCRLGEKEIYPALETALSIGYKSIDTAFLYKNERFIGNFLTENYICRNDIWLTSKLSPRVMVKTESEIIKSILTTLSDLNTDYLDLYLLHSPNDIHMIKCWSILEQFKHQGVFKNIGVSNFKINDLQKITEFSTEPIFTNQIELSPFLTRTELTNYMRKHNIPISAHSSLTKGEKLSDPDLKQIAESYNKTPAQIMLSSGLTKGYNIIPRSGNPEHIRSNINSYFAIRQEDIDRLDKLNIDYYTHP